MSKLAFSRNHAPIGGSEVPPVDALWLAGHTELYVRGAVKRMTWSISPDATSSKRTRPGRIGNPAASPEVHPSGRMAFELRSHVAPEPAVHDAPPFCG